ncbi:transcriptional regulator [Serinibacter arcticus]|uniref:Transcriptional regulator n=1 Tax=Serinibacter arcticus TaxID=1655435 RepID=A0A2U1ZUL4_9MICO|nr:substrate-binding domain-containing protein [Serinibacter arcticus]PWD50675.1 transcriptional regulator [Serinibacter arcticus]
MTDLPSLLPATRRTQLMAVLQREGTARVSELAAATGVSAVTIRRDITQLAEEGLVTRVHGGATLAAPSEPGPAPATATAGANGVGPTSESGERHEIGMLVPSLDYYWPDVVRGAEAAARDLGYRLVLRGSSYEADDDRRQLARLVERGVSALVAAPRLDVPSTDSTLAWLAGLDIPVVLVERDATSRSHRDVLESVTTDHALGAAMAVRHLASLGHARIGLVTSLHSPHSSAIRAGWAAAAQECGFSPADTVEAEVPDKSDPAWDTLLDEVPELCRSTGTTALLVHADSEAMTIAQHADKHGLVVPRDLSVIAYDDEVVSLFSPPMSAVRPPRRSVGKAAVELVVARIDDPDRPIHRIVINPSLRVRDTCTPPQAASVGTASS